MGVWVFCLIWALTLKEEYDPPDKYYITPEIPYTMDPNYKAFQDSLVNRALMKKDTTPFKTIWVSPDNR